MSIRGGLSTFAGVVSKTPPRRLDRETIPAANVGVLDEEGDHEFAAHVVITLVGEGEPS